MKLYIEKSQCCNCNGCTQICPKNAIYKIIDSDGFVYPEIDSKKCIDCGLCQKVCAYQHIQETNIPIEVFVAAANDSNLKKRSASGGIFAIAAKRILENKGIVYGAVMERTDGKFEIYHKGIEKESDLHLLQGSKYVQSEIRDCYKEIKKHLSDGRDVLFCGVPCQCAGLKGFLRKHYDNLYIVDIICHGVPSQQLFNDFIDFKFGIDSNISGFTFRDKSKGWELSARLNYGNGKHIHIPAGTSSYYSLFLDAQTYRKNCYSCKYANSNRTGDITIGDYWGIQKEHPELLEKLNMSEGVSCIIVNNKQGEKLISLINGFIIKASTSYKKVANRNAQLLIPSKEGTYRKKIFEIYGKYGYCAVESFFKKHYFKQIIIHTVLAKLPYRIKSVLRKLK